MHNKRKGIHFFFIYQNIQFHKLTSLITTKFVIQRRISSGTRFQGIKEIVNNLIQWKLIFQKSSCLFHIFHAKILTTALLAKIHNGTDKFCSYHNLSIHDWLFHIFDLRWIWKIGRICQINHFAVCLVYFVNNAWSCSNKIQVIFTFQTFLNDFQMKQSKKSAAETKSKSNRCLRLIE